MQKSWFEMMSMYWSEYPSWAVDVGIFGGTFFLIGFILKLFGRYVLWALLALLIALTIAHYTGMVIVDIVKIKIFFGLKGVTNIQEAIQIFLMWGKNHIFAFVGAILGFLMGWMIG